MSDQKPSGGGAAVGGGAGVMGEETDGWVDGEMRGRGGRDLRREAHHTETNPFLTRDPWKRIYLDKVVEKLLFHLTAWNQLLIWNEAKVTMWYSQMAAKVQFTPAVCFSAEGIKEILQLKKKRKNDYV